MEVISAITKLGIDKIMWALAILIIGIVLTKYVIKLVGTALTHIPSIDPALHAMLKAVLKFILYFLTIMVTASYVGIPVTSLLALFSVVGLAVSLAVQGVLTNLAGGVIILAAKMFTL